jgi:predicted GNAT family acetyltransferase
MTHPLENPIWFALTTRQAGFGRAAGPAARFQAEVNALAGLEAPTPDALHALAGLLHDGEVTGIFVDDEPALPPALERVDGAPLLQMIHEDAGALVAAPAGVIELGAADVPDMLDLATRTRPGPFRRRTAELGTFLGVRDARSGRLLAMAGERLRLDGFTEVSGVCTDPAATGRGLAAALVSEIVRRILATGAVPFLHVRGDNDRAIAIYHRLGFGDRRRSRYVVVRRVGS